MADRRHETSLLPDWLLTDENYIPRPGRDTYISRSILSILRILSKIKAQDKRKEAKYKVNAVFKVAFTFMLVILLSLSKNYAFVIMLIIYQLVVISSMTARDIIGILRLGIIAAFFTFIVLLPAVLWRNDYSSIMITSKVFASVTAVGILSHSAGWSALSGTMKRFYIPDIFIFVFDITVKYIYMLGDLALNMLYALKLRSVGKNKRKYTSMSGIGGTVFIKSKEMAEDMYDAMECRGFTGEYHIYSNFKLGIADLIYIAFNIGIILLFIYFERI
jgi:cobalt/nickel transport system permease protein